MPLARTLGRVAALVVALAGLAVGYSGLTAPANFVVGSEPVAVGPLTGFDLVGVGGVVVALAALAVVFGRGRSAAVSLGTLLVVVSAVALAVAPLAWTATLGLFAVGLLLFFAGASLTGRRPRAGSEAREEKRL